MYRYPKRSFTDYLISFDNMPQFDRKTFLVRALKKATSKNLSIENNSPYTQNVKDDPVLQNVHKTFLTHFSSVGRPYSSIKRGKLLQFNYNVLKNDLHMFLICHMKYVFICVETRTKYIKMIKLKCSMKHILYSLRCTCILCYGALKKNPI